MTPAASGAVRLWRALAAAEAALDAGLDVTPGEGTGSCAVLGSDTVAVLLPLAEAPGQRLQMHVLAERSQLTRSGLTRRVDRLEADDLVRRTACDTDRRVAYAELTDRGRTELAGALPHHATALERRVAAQLAPDELEQLTELLERLACGGGYPPTSTREPGDDP